jgi:hypothetical protein
MGRHQGNVSVGFPKSERKASYISIFVYRAAKHRRIDD